jgi:hypothetical protein
MPRSGTEVVGAELNGDTDHGSGLGRRMERDRSGRHGGGGESTQASGAGGPRVARAGACGVQHRWGPSGQTDAR